MSSNAFEDSAPPIDPADLRRAAEIILAWRKGDAHLCGTILREADNAHRVSYVVAALAYLCNKELDHQADIHGEEGVETAIRRMIAGLAASEGDD